jgi:hypothetical protein
VDLIVGEHDPDLDGQLSDELDAVNAARTTGVPGARELTVKVVDDRGLAAGVSGWTWGIAAGVTSFTFQAPGFYQRHGYRELFRWDGVPREGDADVHFRKDL